jgi:metacaspase-1
MLRPTSRVFRHLCAALLAMAWAPWAQAEDRALLIGVGQYRSGGVDLPGIELDIGVMKDVAEGLGFKPSATRVLLHRQATLAEVRTALQQWLVEGTGPDDRVLLYYSGHGTQLPDDDGDEDDGLDEALTLHDMATVQRNGRTTLDGVLLDDELAETLAKIRSRQVLVLVDACHSGTATRALPGVAGLQRLGVREAVPKFIRVVPAGGGAARSITAAPRAEEAHSDNYVAISAAGDSEESLATARGSVFTMALHDALIGARAAGRLSPRELWQKATAYIAARLDDPRRFRPQLQGSLQLADSALPLAPVLPGQGPAWRKLEALARDAGGVAVTPDKPRYREGDRMNLTLRIARAGHLNVVAVGPDDVPVVLFPNGDQPDARVAAGALTLPTPAMRFSFIASRPFGGTLVTAFVTDAPLDLHQVAEGERDDAGRLREGVGRLTEAGVQQARALRAAGGYRAGSTVLKVCAPTGECR